MPLLYKAFADAQRCILLILHVNQEDIKTHQTAMTDNIFSGLAVPSCSRPEGFMAGQQLVGLPTGTPLIEHGPAEGGTGPWVAPLSTPVPPTLQQLVTGGTARCSFLITRQSLILHLPVQCFSHCASGQSV